MEAALRKFDGAEEAPRRKQRKASWWASHQRQFGAFVTTALIAVVSVPVALTVLRDQPKPVPPRASAPAAVQSSPASPTSVEPAEPQPSQAEGIVADVPRSRLPLEPHEESR